jgi:cysteine-rich repeat protein
MSIHSSIIGNCDKLICKFSLTESAFCNAFSSAFAMHGQCIVKCMRCWLVALLLVGGCVESSLVVCGDKLCPVGAFCTPDGCVLQDQIDVCRDKAEGDPCQVLDLPAGFCRNGTCVSAVCGNTLMEPNEACDDGNHEAGDGCSADCRSLEKCGNNIIDLINNEQCDVGVPFLSGDGCTSSCQAEFDIWRDVTPTQLSARWGAKMVRDPVHDEIVMFGGFNSAALGDTWVLRAGAWEKRTPASSPEPRYGHAMAYLPNVGVVMFGGTNGQGIYFNGTWVWNGSSWTKLNIDPSTAPSDRSGAAMALNPQNDHLMLFGGSHGATVYGDTWEFDGSSWSKVSTPTVSGMPFVTMFVDPNAGVPDSGAVWILGGDGSSTGGKLLFWEISQWVTHLPPGGIPPYVEPGISVDHSRVVLFGGRDQNTGLPTSTTYFWDSDNWQWTSQIVTGAPTGRSRVAAANDGTNLVVYGGVSSVNTPLSGTHQLTTVTIPTTSYRYTTIPTTPLPSARFGAMSTYDGRTGEIFIFGGYTPINSEDADLWRWTFPLWRTGSVEPPGRMHGAMVYDEAREETVLFGGADDCATGSGGGSGGGPCDGAGSGSGSGGTGSVVYFDDTRTLKDNDRRCNRLRPDQRDRAVVRRPERHGLARRYVAVERHGVDEAVACQFAAHDGGWTHGLRPRAFVVCPLWWCRRARHRLDVRRHDVARGDAALVGSSAPWTQALRVHLQPAATSLSTVRRHPAQRANSERHVGMGWRAMGRASSGAGADASLRCRRCIRRHARRAPRLRRRRSAELAARRRVDLQLRVEQRARRALRRCGCRS